MLLEGSVAVVTGAGSGIGREITSQLAAEGAAVVLAGRSMHGMQELAGRIRDDGGRALVVPMDLTDPASIQAGAAQALAEFGRVDILVNNSGVGGPSKPLWEVDLEEWEQTFQVNVTGAFLCCRAFLPTMIAAKSGSIIMIGSVTGKRPLVNRTPYAASKMALIGLVRTLATEIGPLGIRVNLVSPGAVEGERMDWAIERQAAARGVSLAESKASFTDDAPLKRMVTAREVAEATAFLASPKAAAITGQDLNVAAGLVMY
ncbi:MAG TPA: SDR family NAD(P)-dependent oxidoreductase [Mycobacteriales bacterium]|jgi:NAD(P)-dependent dehydrogenase (short-subunit alcohol dehydrogenase family)|nr:SDR family NAD(P)-dependent oxidoreductase [Mycobacteriales bacterium]